MNKLVLSLAFLALSNAAFAQNKKAPPPPPPPPHAPAPGSGTIHTLKIGDDIPNAGMPLPDASGEGRLVFTLDQVKTDAGLLVMFSCNTCPYVVKAQRHTKEAMAEAAKLGIGMVIINSNEAKRQDEDSPPKMKEYATAQAYKVPYLIDEQSQLADFFGATRTPEVFLFDGSGKLVYKGALEDNPADPDKSKHHYLVEAMNAMASKQPVKPAETKSIGCSIKRMGT